MTFNAEVFLCKLWSADLLYLKCGAGILSAYPSLCPSFLLWLWEAWLWNPFTGGLAALLSHHTLSLPRPTHTTHSCQLALAISWSLAWLPIVHFWFLTRICPLKVYMFLNMSRTSSDYLPCLSPLFLILCLLPIEIDGISRKFGIILEDVLL